VYAREIQGKTYMFGVSEKLWANGLVMYDHQTDSLWSHVAGQAITGPMQGTKLTMLPATRTDWATWKQLHLETLVIEPLKSLYRRNYSVDPYEGYYYSQETGVIGTRREDQRLNPKAFVIGLRLDGQVKAYPFTRLSKAPVVNDTVANTPVVVVFRERNATGMVFSRRVGERVLTFTPGPASATERLTMKDAETGSVWSGLDGRALAGPLKGKRLAQISATYAFWFAWKDYYPETAVYGEESQVRPQGARN
jgi:Protein of unknown function (DUF3179)